MTSISISKGKLLFILSAIFIIHNNLINSSNLSKIIITPQTTKSTNTTFNNGMIINAGTNSSQYTWTGKYFYPPKGVPIFSPMDYMSYFSKRNTLFIGDSTARRSYATLFGIMNSSDYTNINFKEIDNPHVIDINKSYLSEICIDGQRSMNISDGSYLCRDLSVSKKHGESIIVSNHESKSKIGKFDYLKGLCFWNLIELLASEEIKSSINSNNTSNNNFAEAIKDDYDLIVIALGIWDAAEPLKCSYGKTSVLTLKEELDLAFHLIKNLTSLSNLQIVFRTPGFKSDHDGDQVVWDIIHYANNFIGKLESKNNNIVLVDWGSVVHERSYENRIRGDVKPHYGLEARLLFNQQLLHELLLSSWKL